MVVIDESGYRLGPGLGLVLAFSVGGEHLSAALVDAAGDVHCATHLDPEPRQLTASPAVFLQRVRELGMSVVSEALDRPDLLTPSRGGRDVLRLIGAAAAWPVPLDRATKVRAMSLGPEWHARSLREHLAAALDLPLSRCHAINDANAGALKVAFDQGDNGEVGSVMCVVAAAGIGVGTVHQALGRPNRLPFIDAHLIAGSNGVAGELGHVAVDSALVNELNGAMARRRKGRQSTPGALDATRVCDCGVPTSDGHLQAVIGAEALLDRLKRYEEGASLVDRLGTLRADAASDIKVKLALQHVGQLLARALDGPVAIIDPAVIVLVGALAHPEVINGMRERRSAGDMNYEVRIEMYDQQRNALVGLTGAALAVLRAALYRGFFDHPTKSVDAEAGSPWECWSGWDHEDRGGTQTGETPSGGAWEYHPILVNRDWVAERRDQESLSIG